MTSTGKICAEIAEEYENQGWEVKIAYGRLPNVPDKYKKFAVRIGNITDVYGHVLYSRLSGKHGFASKRSTQKFLEWAEFFSPDLVWLHNLHGYYINIEMLFRWLKLHPEIEKKWTLHDCWAFTGNCGYFSYVKCEKWKIECGNCPQLHRYPNSLFLDNTKSNFRRKKELFTGVKKLSLIVPSKWLARLVSESILREYPLEVIYNKIDTAVFRPRKSDIKEILGLEEKVVILGVANIWEKRKGLDDFISLAKMLDGKYAIILVGLSKKQIKEIPKQVKGIQRAESHRKMDELHCSVDVFVNASKEVVFKLTSVKALSRGGRMTVCKDTACENIMENNEGIAIEPGAENLYYAITGQKWDGEKSSGVAVIICMSKISSPEKMAELYSISDYYANPTYEDNYPTTNLEAKRCGAFVVTYDSGGARETIERDAFEN